MTGLLAAMLLLSVFLGSYVGLRLPSDPSAIFLFGMLIGLSQYIRSTSFLYWPTWAVAIGASYSNLAMQTFPISMMLFGIYFPERSRFDVRRPWIKWILIAPALLFAILQTTAIILSQFSFELSAPLENWLEPLIKPAFAISFMMQLIFFFAFTEKSQSAAKVDTKRRFRIQYVGAAISLTPLLLLLLYSFAYYHGNTAEVPQRAVIVVALSFLLLPVTLAYVVLVERATDLQVVIRQGLRYASAKTGLRVITFMTIARLIWLFSYFIFSSRLSLTLQILLDVAVCIVVIVSLGRIRVSMAQMLDRRFFREAYQSELILGELNETVQTMIDESAVLNTVGSRISESLHVPCIAILLNHAGQLTSAYAVGLERVSSLTISERSFVVGRVRSTKDLGQIYWDTSENWIFRAPLEEIELIRSLRAQLLLPILFRKRLLGILSLGPKRSEESLPGTDLNLLRSIALQMGLALENSRLASAVASEVAQREKLNREVEIAREVQQRLFPHELPFFPELDYFGSCRPALGVGGDYYNFLKLGDDTLGIAIGDVSGKGIAAALLMASLQASLRGPM